MKIQEIHQQRFDRQLYLHYVKQNNDFKIVSKEVYYDVLSKFESITPKVVYFDKNNIYRLADEKIICSLNNQTIAEAWGEKDRDFDGEDVESYWINTERPELEKLYYQLTQKPN